MLVELVEFPDMHITAKLNVKIFDQIDDKQNNNRSIIAKRVRLPKMQSIDEI
jgi:hypothetical protein